MDFMYGRLNKIIEKIEYTGNNSSTIKVTVNNSDSTIQADLNTDLVPREGSARAVTSGGLYLIELALQNSVNGVSMDLSNHTLDLNNPHQVNKVQVGLGNVVNAPLDQVVEEGSENYITSGAVYTSYATIQTRITDTENALGSLSTDVNAHIGNTNNPHSVTKAQVGLGNVVDAAMDSNPTEGSVNYATSGGVYTIYNQANTAISTINAKIPTQATSQNQLADKDFVNSTIQTATANYRGNWGNWASVPLDVSLYPEDYVGSKTPTVNDYLVVQDASDYDLQTLEGTWRFKYTGTWATEGKSGWKPEYQVNETPLTAAQLAAINSGITATLVTQIGTNQNNITNHIGNKNNPHEVTKAQLGLGNVENKSLDTTPASGSGNYITSNAVYNADIQCASLTNGNTIVLQKGSNTSWASLTIDNVSNATNAVNVNLSNAGSTGTVVKIQAGSGTATTIPSADATNAGVVTNAAQTIGGIKTFESGIKLGTSQTITGIDNTALSSNSSNIATSNLICAINDSISSHTSNTSNPHSVTKAQVGLSLVENKSLDTTITQGSGNYITSGAVYAAIISTLNTPV